MPEVITKHPDVVKQVLESAGARCGSGEPQKILTKCPREQFCALPGGEICVYGVEGIPKMTQLSRAELCQARSDGLPPDTSAPPVTLGAALPAVAAAGLFAAATLRRRRRRHARDGSASGRREGGA